MTTWTSDELGRFGGAYVDPMVAARSTTLKLVPR